MQIRARERSAESAVAVPLDHPSRTADLAQLAAWKWRCSADAAAERVERLAAELTGAADKEQA